MDRSAMAKADEVPESVARGGRALGRHPSSWVTPIFGLSDADRFVVAFDDGSTAFVHGDVRSENVVLLGLEPPDGRHRRDI